MRNFIFCLIVMFSVSSHAQSLTNETQETGSFSLKKANFNPDANLVSFKRRGGDMGGGKVVIKESDVEAFITKDDVYVRPVDLRDGIEYVEGVEVYQNIIQLNFKKPNFGLDRVLMNDGKIMRVSAEGGSGGNAGGT